MSSIVKLLFQLFLHCLSGGAGFLLGLFYSVNTDFELFSNVVNFMFLLGNQLGILLLLFWIIGHQNTLSILKTRDLIMTGLFLGVNQRVRFYA